MDQSMRAIPILSKVSVESFEDIILVLEEGPELQEDIQIEYETKIPSVIVVID